MEPKHSHKRALVIDDDEDLTALIELVLSRHGTEVVTAFTGQQGLQYFKEVQPDVVILDVMLPGMNGWEVLNRLRATSDVPVIVHTVLTDADSRKRGRHLGAADYITKPQLPQEFAERVASIINSYSSESIS